MYFNWEGVTYSVRIVRVGNSTFAELMEVKGSGHLKHTNIVGKADLYYKDNFVAQTGRKQAMIRLLDRLTKELGVTKEVKAEIWAQFFEKYGA